MHLNDGQKYLAGRVPVERRFLAGTDVVRLNGFGLLARDARRQKYGRDFADFNGGIPCPKGWLVPQSVTDACEALKREGTSIAKSVENAVSPVVDTAKSVSTYFSPSRPSGGNASPSVGVDQPDQSADQPQQSVGGGNSVRQTAPTWISKNWKIVLGGALVLGLGAAVVRRK